MAMTATGLVLAITANRGETGDKTIEFNQSLKIIYLIF
jgi:hypothetical protein